MAGLTTDARAAIAFKKLLGLANTSTQNKAFFNESIPSQVSIFTNEIASEEIPSDPTTAVNDGIAEQVDCELKEISGTNGYAYDIVFPSGYSGAFQSSVTAGSTRIRQETQIIPNKFNTSPIDSGGYGYVLYDGPVDPNNRISITDPSKWQVDPVAGIIKTDETESPLDLASDSVVRVYLYTGDFLRKTLDDIAANAGNVEVLNNGSSLTTDVDSLDFTTNLTATNSGGDVTVTNDVTSTDDLNEGSNLYFTDERAQDAVANFLVGGTNVTLTEDDPNNTFTIDATDTNTQLSDEEVQDAVYNNVLSGTQTLISVTYDDANNEVDYVVNDDLSLYDNSTSGFTTYDSADFDTDFNNKTTDDLSEGSTNLYYTNERAQDAAASLIVAGNNLSRNYDDGANTLTLDVENNLSSYNVDITTDDISEGSSNFYYTGERVDDRVDDLLVAGSHISLNYQDSNNSLTISADDNLSQYTNDAGFITDLSGFTTTDLDEPSGGISLSNIPDTYSDGGNHPYFTKTRARDAFSAAGDLNYDQSIGEFSVNTYSSSNFDADFSTKTTDDLSEGSNNKYFSDELAQDAVANALIGGTNIAVTYNDSTDELIIDQTGAGTGIEVTDPDDSGFSSTGIGTLNFGAELRVEQNTSGEVTIDFIGSGGGGVLIEDSVGSTQYQGSLVEQDSFFDVAGISAIDFNDQLEVIDDGDGTVTINSLVPTEDIDTRLDQLENLLPTAPDLQNTSTETGTPGRLSFSSNNGISGVTPDPNKDVGDLFPVSGADKGIIDQGFSGTSFVGTLNPNVSSTDNHDAQVFDDATTGTLELWINGTELTNRTIDLSSTDNAIDTISGGTGLSVSAAEPLTFADGSDYNGNYQRTGDWAVGTDELRSGWNRIEIRHYDGSTLIGQTGEFYFILDDDHEDASPRTISAASTSFGSGNPSGTKALSGISYYRNFSADISFTIDNIYPYTYQDGNAITVNETRFNSVSGPGYSIPVPSDETDQVTINDDVNSTDLIKKNGFNATVTVSDPVESDVSFSFSDFDLLVDDYANNNTSLVNFFDSEERRIPGDGDFDGDFSKGVYDSSVNIVTGTSGYNDGLQVDMKPARNGHRLIYPNEDYTTITNSPSNPDYSGATGQRYYWGWWSNSTSAQNFVLRLEGSATIIPDSQNFTTGSNELKIAIKLPSGNSTGTGWLDVTQDFVPGEYGLDQNLSDGRAPATDGCFNSSEGSDFNFSGGTEIGITTGTKSTADSYDKMYYRFFVPENWTGNISRARIEWPA